MAGKSKHLDKSEAIYDFYKIYAQKVAPILQEMEVLRKKKFTNLIIISSLLALGSLLFSFLDTAYFITALSIVILAIIFIWYVAANDFVQKVKKKCMPLLLQAFCDIHWYKKETVSHSIISDSELKNSELFSDYNKREDDDAFDGTYKGVNFSVVETHLYILTEGRHKMYWKVFKGAIIKFDSNKTIRNKTIITTKGDINTKNNDPMYWILLAIVLIPTLYITIFDPGFAYSNYDPVYFFKSLMSSPLIAPLIFLILIGIISKFFNQNSEKLNSIKLEDPEFNKCYNMYSSDEIEGRYLVTTAFMQRFKNLHTSFGSKKAKCSFCSGTIIFSIPTNKNLFEIGSFFLPLTNQQQINTFLEEISAIYDLIDYFKLDEKTGL